ncbi:MAG TPA: KOW domain-containing RNA-binding protein [Acetivibrio sp.]|mgnify:FL=1|uniref:KOW domain-containing RNA-binding protein n=1 Tax=Acetivibrio sp. TaxID=1872092 RepID=UPI002C29A3E0|nr:KOW domain-containing RNA-binding protein [Acetivibrio sp.]HOM02983.1 KOW domain-containing RNA-binding protein [Acetivibrio sp.]
MKVDVGQVVYSKAGRDFGRKFVVIGIIDDKSVLVADGDLRRVEKPKSKNIKHLRITEKVILPLSDKLKNGTKVSNSEIRKVLAEIGDAEDEFN